ncbi:extracellular solute-binding protein [Caballeronia peredens]|nr:extracellular solute-binding protein [Caballeronia peredens]
MMKKLIAVAVALSATSAFAGQALDQAKESNQIIVGHRTNSAPYSAENNKKGNGFAVATNDGTFVEGYSLEITKYIIDDVNKAVGKNLTVVPKKVDSGNRMAFIKTGQIAIEAGSTTITDERKKDTDFVLIDLDSVNALYLSSTKFNSVEDLRGTNVVVAAGSTGLTAIQALNNKGFNINVMITKDYPEALSKLNTHQAQFLVTDRVLEAGLIAKEEAGKYSISKTPVSDLKEPIGIMIYKNDAELVKIAHNAVDKLRANGKLAELHEKYFNSDFTGVNLHLPLTAAQKSELGIK